MSENPISGIITDFVNKFVRFYVSSFRGIMPGGYPLSLSLSHLLPLSPLFSLTGGNKSIDSVRYGNRKVQDIFKNGFALADEHRAIGNFKFKKHREI
jgi:hypothetical protein